MKTLVVREAFSMGADHFPRGAEITDPAVIPLALESFPGHVLKTQQDAEQPKAAKPAADKAS